MHIRCCGGYASRIFGSFRLCRYLLPRSEESLSCFFAFPGRSAWVLRDTATTRFSGQMYICKRLGWAGEIRCRAFYVCMCVCVCRYVCVCVDMCVCMYDVHMYADTVTCTHGARWSPTMREGEDAVVRRSGCDLSTAGGGRVRRCATYNVHILYITTYIIHHTSYIIHHTYIHTSYIIHTYISSQSGCVSVTATTGPPGRAAETCSFLFCCVDTSLPCTHTDIYHTKQSAHGDDGHLRDDDK